MTEELRAAERVRATGVFEEHDRGVLARAYLAANPPYTQTPPTVAGWYWYRQRPTPMEAHFFDKSPRVVEVSVSHVTKDGFTALLPALVVNITSVRDSDEWRGPISPSLGSQAPAAEEKA